MADPKRARKTDADQMEDAIWFSGSGRLESFFWIGAEIEFFGVDADGDELTTMRRFQVRTQLFVYLFPGIGDRIRVEKMGVYRHSAYLQWTAILTEPSNIHTALPSLHLSLHPTKFGCVQKAAIVHYPKIWVVS